MTRGKRTCKILKEIRRQIAEANDIDYVVEECRYKGDCLGTCPKCEAEVSYLEQQLHQRQLLGKAVMVAGVSMGLITLNSCGTSTYDQLENSEDEMLLRGKEPISNDQEPVFQVVGQIIENMPSFPGGNQALQKFISENVNYPETESCVQGKVICGFTVKKDGTISDITVKKSVAPEFDAEAVRVISIMPKWIPGKLNGQATEVKYTLPITFRLK